MSQTVTTTRVQQVKQKLVSEVYLERLLTSRVPATESVLGVLIWSGIVIGFAPDRAPALWMLAALVGLPVTLRLAERPSAGPTSASLSWLRVLTVPAATVSSLSLFTSGFPAFVLSLPWLMLAVLVGLAGLMRFLSRASAATPMTAMDIGLMSVGLCGAAFTLSRMDVDAVAAVDLHALAFVLPAVAALAAEQTAVRWWWPLVAALGVTGGAAGILAGGWMTVAGHGTILLSGATVATLLVKTAGGQSGTVRMAFTVGGLCLVAGLGALVAVESVLPALEVAGGWVDTAAAATGPVIVVGFGLPVLCGMHQLVDPTTTASRRTLFHLGPPTREQRSRLADDLFTQSPKGFVDPLATEPPAGHRLLRVTRRVDDFENSCDALWTWAGHEAARIDMTPDQPPIVMGQNLVFIVPVGLFTVTATGRITALISDDDHYGFVLSSLDHHPLVATEAIMLDRSSGTATLTISMVWRPNCVGAGLLGPLTQWVLGRTTRRYLDGIAEAETAAVGAHMHDLMSEVSKRQYAISRDSIRAGSRRDLLGSPVETEAPPSPLGEFEAFFATPVQADPEGSDSEPPADPRDG